MKAIHEIDNIQEHFDELYQKIKDSDYMAIEEIGNINGIYVFFENDKAIYVGRSNRDRMRLRLRVHSRRSSTKDQASFAFRIAKDLKNDPELKDIHKYDKHFLEAKERVRKMKVKIIPINDPFIQTMFEPYLAFKLNTVKYNNFMTH